MFPPYFWSKVSLLVCLASQSSLTPWFYEIIKNVLNDRRRFNDHDCYFYRQYSYYDHCFHQQSSLEINSTRFTFNYKGPHSTLVRYAKWTILYKWSLLDFLKISNNLCPLFNCSIKHLSITSSNVPKDRIHLLRLHQLLGSCICT